MTECHRPRCTVSRESGPHCRKHRLMLQNAGISGFIDATPAREKIQDLHDRGWSFYRIGRRAGIATATVQRIGRGISRRAYAPTVNALAAVEQHGERWVNATGTRRRISALVRMGWTYVEISRLTGIPRDTLRKVTQRSRVNAENADAVSSLYERLHLTPGPSQKARTAGVTRGFHPPFAWDLETIDDPTAEPNYGGEDTEVDEVLVQLVVAGKVNDRSGNKVTVPLQDRLEAIRRMLLIGVAPTAMAARIGTSKEIVDKLISQVRPESEEAAA